MGGGGGGGGRPPLGGMERAGGGEELRPREAGSWASWRLRGLTRSAPLPAETLEMPTTGFVASPPSLGRCAPVPLRLRQSLEQLKLGSRDAQPIREGSGGKLGRGREPLFPPSPKSAPAGQAGPLPGRAGSWVGGKHRPSRVGSWELRFLTLLPHLLETPPRWWLLPCLRPPSLANSAWGAGG